MNPALLDSPTSPRPVLVGDVPDVTRAQALAGLLAAHDADVAKRQQAAVRKAHRQAVLAGWWQTARAVVRRPA